MATSRALRAGIVARVSSGDDDSDFEERSNAEQREACEADCAKHGWAVAGLYEMVQSASRFARTQRQRWLDLRDDIEHGLIDIVVMWEPSRGSRDLTDWSGFLDRCRKHGVLIHVVIHEREPYDMRRSGDWHVLATHGVDSAHESDKISDRTHRAVEANARQGRPHSWTYGYEHTYERRKKRMMLASQVPKEPEASIAREIVRRVAAGEPVSAIVADLNRRQVTPPSGERSKSGRWYPQEVRRIASNPMYIGKREWPPPRRRSSPEDFELLDGNWEPLVTETEWLAAVRVLSERRIGRTRPGKYVWLLSDVATCAKCGAPLRVFPGRVYACKLSGSHGAGHLRVPVNDLDLWVEGLILGRLCEDDVIGAFINADDSAAEAARAEAEKLQQRLDKFIRSAALSDDVGPREVGMLKRELEPLIAAAKKRANDLALPGALRPFAGVLGKAAAVHELWLTTPLAAKRDVIRALCESVTLSFTDAPLAERVIATWRQAPLGIPAGSRSEPLPQRFDVPSWAEDLD